MQFVNMPYNILPRLTQEEAKYKANQIPINALSEEYAGIRYNDIINYADWNNVSFNEALDDIISANEINDRDIVILVNEYAHYFNFKPIIKEAFKYPIQFYYNGLNESSFILESAIKQDIINESTENTDTVLNELFGKLFGLAGDTVKQHTQQVVDTLNTPENRQKVFGAVKDQTNEVIKGIASSLGDNTKKAATGVVLGTMAFTADQMNKHPEEVKQTVINLKNKLMQLTGLQKQAPPEKQGIISSLIAKIKAMLAKIGSKIGFNTGG